MMHREANSTGTTGGTEIRALWEHPALHLALIALVGLLAYANSFQVPFILDDYRSIVRNGVIRDLGTFLSGAGYGYNPRRFVGYLTLALNYRLGGLDVTGYHIANLAIHVASAWLVYALARLTLQTPFFVGSAGCGVRSSECGMRNESHSEKQYVDLNSSRVSIPNSEFRILNSTLPLLAALLFVAHPVQTQAVTYVVQRFASLCTLFYLLSVTLYASARTSGKAGRRRGRTVILYLLSLTSALIAMKTKEIAFTLPLAVVLYEVTFFRMGSAKRLLLLSPLLLTALLVPISLLGAGKPLGEIIADVAERTRVDSALPRLHYLYTQFRVLVTYLRLLVFPVRQNLDYDYPVYTSFLSPPVFLSFLLLIALVGMAAWLYYRSGLGIRDQGITNGNTSDGCRIPNPEFRLIAFGILWFFLTLSVESSLIPIADVIFEHRLYLATPGAFLAFSAAFFRLSERVPRAWTLSAAGTVVIVLAVATFSRNAVWSDPVTLARDVVAKSPGKARPRFNLADVLSRAGWTDEALREAAVAARIDPRRAEPHTLMGTLYSSQGNYDRAIAELSQAVSLEPAYAAARNALGNAYAGKGMSREALEQYQVSLKLTPGDPEIYNRIGLIHAAAGQPAQALAFFESAVRLGPNNVTYRSNLARAAAGLSEPLRRQ